jgi:hypothetical protein
MCALVLHARNSSSDTGVVKHLQQSSQQCLQTSEVSLTVHQKRLLPGGAPQFGDYAVIQCMPAAPQQCNG